MKKLILILAVAAFVCSPVMVSQAEAAGAKPHAAQHHKNAGKKSGKHHKHHHAKHHRKHKKH